MAGELDSGGGGGGGDDDSGGGDGSTDSGGDTGGTGSVLTSFATNPRKFILGAVLTTILEGVFSIFSEGISVLQLLFLGSAPATSSAGEEVWGIADIIAGVFRVLGDAGLEGGAVIIRTVQSVNDPLYELAGVAGPAAPLIIAVFVSVEVVVVLIALESAVKVLLDVVPGLGGLV